MNRTAIDLEKVRAMYEDQKLSSAQIATTFGVSPSCVLKHLRSMNVEVRRRGPRPGSLHPGWKGGVTIDKGGYVLRHCPDHPYANLCGYVREHRLVIEKLLGRYLLPQEVVHHIDDDPSNNSPSNLRLYRSNADHLADTRKGRRPNWSRAGYGRVLAAVRQDRVAKHVDWNEAARVYYSSSSLREAATAIGVEPHLLSRRLKRAGATVRRRGGVEKRWPSPERLAQMYQTMPMKAIAKSLGVAESSVHRKLKAAGVPIRRRCDKAAPGPAMRP